MNMGNLEVNEHDGYRVSRYLSGDKWKENCYLLECAKTRETVLIDPGFGCEPLIMYIEKENMQLIYILFTHAHHDHIASAKAISEHFGVPCTLHLQDKKVFMHAPLYSSRFAGCLIKLPKNLEWVQGDIIHLGKDIQLDLLHTPGHSNGGMCIFFKDIVFTGDTVVKNYLGRTDLPEGNREHLIQSGCKLFEKMKKEKIQFIYPGHGDKWNSKDAIVWWDKNRERSEEMRKF